MTVLVDSSVWSLAFRIRYINSDPYVNELKILIEELSARLIPPVRQEILAGVVHAEDFETLRFHMRAFEDLDLENQDYEEAAKLAIQCRVKGMQASMTDFLLCAVSLRCGYPILTADPDFIAVARHVQVNLHQLRNLS